LLSLSKTKIVSHFIVRHRRHSWELNTPRCFQSSIISTAGHTGNWLLFPLNTLAPSINIIVASVHTVHTVGVAYWFNSFILPPLSLHSFLLLFMLSQQSVFLCVSFTLYNLLKPYGIVCHVIILTKQSSSDLNHSRSIKSTNLQCTPVQQPSNGSSILPKSDQTITIAFLCCHGIMVRCTVACRQHWQCQLIPHQSFMGLGWFIAMELYPSSSSNCSS
jgi:hypothetical protein